MERELLARARRAAEVLFVLVLLAFLGRYVYLRWQEVQQVEFRLTLEYLIAGALGMLVFYLLLSGSWQRILGMLSARPEGAGTWSLHRAFMVAFLTRYMPAGNVVTVGGRVELLKRLGGSRSLGLESVYYEQLYLVLGTLMLGLVAAPLLPFGMLPPWLAQQSRILLIVVGALTVLAAAGPELAIRLAARVFRSERLDRLGTRLRWQDKLELSLRFVGINLLQGAVGYAVLRSVYPATPTDLLSLLFILAAYPLARFVGQAAAIVPGGIGIREGAFAFLLDPMLPIQPVVVTAILLRLLSVLIELLLLAAYGTAEKLADGATQSESPEPRR